MDELISVILGEIKKELEASAPKPAQPKQEAPKQEAPKPTYNVETLNRVANMIGLDGVDPITLIKVLSETVLPSYIPKKAINVMTDAEVVESAYNILSAMEEASEESDDDYEDDYDDDYDEDDYDEDANYDGEMTVPAGMMAGCVCIPGDSLADAFKNIGLTAEEIGQLMTTRVATPEIMEKFRKNGIVVM